MEETHPLLEGTSKEEGRDKEKSQAVHSLEVGIVKLGLWGICGLFLSLVCHYTDASAFQIFTGDDL
jgi:hypothetical protein